MTQRIIYYLVLALLFVAVPMAIAWLLLRLSNCSRLSSWAQ